MGNRRKLDIVVDAEYNGGREIKTAADSIERLGIESGIAASKQELFDKKQKELTNSVIAGTKTIDKASRELAEYGNKLERGTSKTEKAKAAFDNFKGSIIPVGAALGGAAIAAQKTWEAFNKGAELIATEEKFYALADSIGASDAALSRLKSATGGMISDAQLMAGANELISFGIAKNEQEMIDWSNVVSKLDLDLQVLGLTLSNNSMARLDSLGLSMEDVKKKTEEFAKAGKTADEAFDLAVYDALNERVDTIGDSLEGAAKDAKVFAAEMQNIKDEASRATTTGLGPFVSSLSANIQATNLSQDAMKRGLITQEEYNSILQEGSGFLEYNATVLIKLQQAIREAERGHSDATQTQIEYYKGMGELAQRTDEVARVTFDNADATNLYAQAGEAAALAARQQYHEQQDLLELYAIGADATNLYAEAGLAQAEAAQEQAAANERANAALELASGHYESLNGFLGGLDGTAESTAESLDNVAVAIIDSALAAEVAAGNLTPLEAALSSINVQEGLGLIDQAQADELRNAAEQFGLIEEVIGTMSSEMVSAGGITVKEAESMNEAIGMVEEGVLTNSEAIAIMATEGGANLSNLTSDFDTTWDGVDRLERRVGELKDQIIMGLPDEKVINIRINTIGSVPSVGNFNQAATATGVSDELAR